jgi:hypothetical protein
VVEVPGRQVLTDGRRMHGSKLGKGRARGRAVNFRVTVLKVLVNYPDGFAMMGDLIKRDMAILATSGREWAERTKRLAARVPDLDLFSQGLMGSTAAGASPRKAAPFSRSWRRGRPPH